MFKFQTDKEINHIKYLILQMKIIPFYFLSQITKYKVHSLNQCDVAH